MNTLKGRGRAQAPRWRHDAYTLRHLERGIADCVSAFEREGRLAPGRTVVDLGCGSAPYRPLLERAGSFYVGCDLEAGAGVAALIGADGRTNLSAHSADVVASIQVLEHVWSLDEYLGECRRLLVPDGRLLLSTHGTWLFHPHPTDFRRWTRDGLVRELGSRGFEVLRVRPIVGPLAWTTQFRTLAYWTVLSRLGPPGRLLGAGLCLAMYARMDIEDRLTPRELTATNAAVYLLTARVLRPK
jgi:SAM-dependent methyltransferase